MSERHGQVSYVQLTVDGGASGALREEQQVGCETVSSVLDILSLR